MIGSTPCSTPVFWAQRCCSGERCFTDTWASAVTAKALFISLPQPYIPAYLAHFLPLRHRPGIRFTHKQPSFGGLRHWKTSKLADSSCGFPLDSSTSSSDCGCSRDGFATLIAAAHLAI